MNLDGIQRQRMARAAADSARAQYSKDRMCRDTLALYAELLDTDNAVTAAQ